MFVVSLAVADLLVAVYPYPLALASIVNDGWSLSSLHCQLSGFLMGLSVIGSVFNITGIAINRYCCICHSLRYDKLYSSTNSLCYVFLIWLLTFVQLPSVHRQEHWLEGTRKRGSPVRGPRGPRTVACNEVPAGAGGSRQAQT